MLLENKGKVMPFGKYKGEFLEKIPDSYLAWLLKNNVPRENLKEDIEDEVIRRWFEYNYIHKKQDIINGWVKDNFSFKKSTTASGDFHWDGDNYFTDPFYDTLNDALPNYY